MEYVSPEGLRQDGRRPRELRAFTCELHPLPHPDGSAIVGLGNTKVLAAVFGPRTADIRSQALHNKAIVTCEYAEAAFSGGTRHKRRGRGSRKNTELASIIRGALEQTILLELFPRSQVDVCIQVLHADGGVLGACINAAMLAAADAGIPMRDMMAAVSAGYLASTPLLDMNHHEASARHCPEVALAMHTGLAKVVIMQVDNAITPDILEAVTELASMGCQSLAKLMREQLLKQAETIAIVRGLPTT